MVHKLFDEKKIEEFQFFIQTLNDKSQAIQNRIEDESDLIAAYLGKGFSDEFKTIMIKKELDQEIMRRITELLTNGG